jgi:rRNA maturation endonuclease Nob1
LEKTYGVNRRFDKGGNAYFDYCDVCDHPYEKDEFPDLCEECGHQLRSEPVP